MTDLQPIIDRVEIEALRGEFVDAVMEHDYDRLASLFTDDGTVVMPDVGAVGVGREQIRAGAERMQAMWDCFVQETHAGTIQLDGDNASGRAYVHELMNGPALGSIVNHGVWHDRYRRTADGWRFAERAYAHLYLDTTPLRGSAPRPSVPQTAPRPSEMSA